MNLEYEEQLVETWVARGEMTRESALWTISNDTFESSYILTKDESRRIGVEFR